VAFTELLARSSFSFLMGASSPEALVESAHALGQTSLGLCDRDGLYGCVRAHVRAKELGVRLHVGAELSLASCGERVKRVEFAAQPGRSQSSRSRERAKLSHPVIALLVQSQQGYTHLCQLLTEAHWGLPKGVSRLESDFLRRGVAGLTLLVPVQLGAAGRTVRGWLRLLAGYFAGHGYIAVYRRLDGKDAARLRTAQSWSRESGFPIVASARPLFHEQEQKPLADIVQCIRTGQTLEQAGTALHANSEAYLRSETHLLRWFPEHADWVQRSAKLAEQLLFSLDELNYQFPCTLSDGEDADQRLERLSWEGAKRRYPEGIPSKVSQQIAKELRLITQLKVAPYFLCTYEVVEIARNLKILCQGRGSAANSAVCYALGISAVDPARSNLLFERFLSAERAEPPDIDIDFEHERREEVIQALYSRYGRDRAAMVSEVIRYRGKSALRDVGKTFGLSLAQVDQLSQMLTHWDSADISAEQLRSYGLNPEDDRLKQTIRWAGRLEGSPRHLSVHVGGFVLSKTTLSEVAPVEPAAMYGRTVVPWDKDDIEALGFFKVDVLGLGMLTAIRKALALIFADGALQEPCLTAKGEHSDRPAFDPLDVVTRVPSEDKAVYAMVCEADTVGVFQIESRAQMAMLPRLRPQEFYDLVIEVAIVRPGPIQGGMVHPYLQRRNEGKRGTPPHPALEPILDRTLGVPLFQEQVMQIAIVGAGYSGGEADQLRRDMAAWKKSGKLLRHREKLLQGFAKKGIPTGFGEALFEQIKGFGEYGFPESHAASFALLVYLSAWQKVHFPAHFVCALLNSQPMGFYSPASLVRDAREHGVEVRPVCVLCSEWDCTLEPISANLVAEQELSRGEAPGIKSRYPEAQRAMRLGFRLVRGIGQALGLRIAAVRKVVPLSSLEDLILRARLKKDEVEALAEAGALEALIAGRRQALWAARAPRGFGLFEGVRLEPAAENSVQLPPALRATAALATVQQATVPLPKLQRAEQLVMDYERVGFSLTDHPLCHLRPQLQSRGVVNAKDLRELPHQSQVRVAGVVLSRQRPITASGVVFVTLEDETGIMNLVLFSRVFEKYQHAARHSIMMLATGKLERQLTEQKPKEVGRATPVLHVVVEHLERLALRGKGVHVASRDFH
jgi:error-prone DNA polymerase